MEGSGLPLKAPGASGLENSMSVPTFFKPFPVAATAPVRAMFGQVLF